MNQEMVSYIKQRQKLGIPDEKIRQDLLSEGNSEYSVESSFEYINSQKIKKYSIIGVVLLLLFSIIGYAVYDHVTDTLNCVPAECPKGSCGQMVDGCKGFINCGGCVEGMYCSEDNKCKAKEDCGVFKCDMLTQSEKDNLWCGGFYFPSDKCNPVRVESCGVCTKGLKCCGYSCIPPDQTCDFD